MAGSGTAHHLAMELFTLVLFAIVALFKVATMNIHGSITPSLEWFNPFNLSQSALAAGVILGIFIYWGWDSTVNVNEESADPTEGPGKAAVVSTVVLLGVYVLVGVAAQAYHGAGFLAAAAGCINVHLRRLYSESLLAEMHPPRADRAGGTGARSPAR